jgi:TolA-binding protein
MIVPPPCFTVSAKSIHFAVLALSIAGFASHTARATDEHAPAAPSVIPAPAPDAHAPAAAPAPTTHAAATPTDGPEQLVPVAADVEVKSEVQLTSASVSPKEAQGLINLGLSLTDRGDYDAAEIAYRRVMNGDAPIEHTKSALLGLARMHRKKSELTKAAAIYERYLKDYQGDDRIPDALLELGRTLRDMGAPRLAIARFYNVINSSTTSFSQRRPNSKLRKRTSSPAITLKRTSSFLACACLISRRAIELVLISRQPIRFTSPANLKRRSPVCGRTLINGPTTSTSLRLGTSSRSPCGV